MTAYGARRRVWVAAAAGAAGLLLVLGWFLAVQPQLSEAAALRAETDSLRLQNQLLKAQTTSLRRQARHRGRLEGELTEALAALPTTAALPAFSRQVTEQARENRVVLDSILVGDEAAVVTDAADPDGSALRSVPVTLVSRGTGAEQRAFLQAVQEGPRGALVTSTALVPRGTGSIEGPSTMTTQLTVFSAPLPDATRRQLEELLRRDVS